MALIGEMQYLTIGGSTYSIPTGTTVEVERNLTSGTKSATIKVDGTSYDLYAPTPNAGTVTSVRVQATSPVQSSTSTAQSSSLNTTISLANGYGDTKNPYGTKTKNYVLAGPTTGSDAAPTFRALVAADIPDLSGTYLTSYTETDPVYSASAASGITSSDISNWNSKTSNTGTVTSITLTSGTGITVSNSGTAITTSGSRTITLNTIKTSKASSGLGGAQVWKSWEDTSTITSPSTIGSYTGTFTINDSSTVSNRFYPIEATADGHLIVNVPWESAPTKTSDLTNDSGFITSFTDENVKSTTVTAATTYYLTGSTSSSTATGGLSKHAAIKAYVTANSGTGGSARIDLGNTTATTSAGGKEGIIRLYGTSATYYVELKAGAPSANRTISFPNKAGTVALTSDIPTVSYPVTSVNNKTGAVSLSASDVGALPSTTAIPSKTSDLTNDSGFLTSYTETDPVFSASAAAGITSTDISNWNSKTSNTGTITSVKTTAGAHTTINVSSGVANFNVPTATSHLTNDSGFVKQFKVIITDNNGTYSADKTFSEIQTAYNQGYEVVCEGPVGTKLSLLSISSSNVMFELGAMTAQGIPAAEIVTISSNNTVSHSMIRYEETDPDFNASPAAGITATDISNWNAKADSDENVKSTAVTAATTYYLTGSTSSSTATGGLSKHAAIKAYVTANSGTGGSARIDLGNTTATTSAGGKEGIIRLYGTSATYYVELKAGAPSANRTISFPNKAGTIALTSDIPTVSYPVTSVNNKTGAVSLTASDVGALASSTTYVSTITTTAGTHSAISNQSGAVSFNVPTKTSHLTNDSGFITSYTDEKVKTKAATASSDYYVLMGTNTNQAETKIYDIRIKYSYTNGTSSTPGIALLSLGNDSNVLPNSIKGRIKLYAQSGSVTIDPGTSQNSTVLTLPNTTGTLALTSDIPDTSGFISTETDPVFSASAAAGITSTDISNWNAKVSDTGKWNDVTLSHGTATGSANNFYLPALGNASNTTASLLVATQTPTNYAIAKYGSGAYLYSTTPSANDNSTKVATTAYVDAAIPTVPTNVSAFTNDSGYAVINNTTVTLTTAGWSNNSQSVTVTGVTTSNSVIVTAAAASESIYLSCGVKCSSQAANALTFTCITTPTAAIDVNVIVLTGN